MPSLSRLEGRTSGVGEESGAVWAMVLWLLGRCQCKPFSFELDGWLLDVRCILYRGLGLRLRVTTCSYGRFICGLIVAMLKPEFDYK